MATLAFIGNMGFFEWLILFGLLFIFFRRTVARSAGRTVGKFTASATSRPSDLPPDADESAKYLQVLELSAAATPEQVREAYRELVKVWHPDRFAHDEKLKERATAKLKEINDAYEKLTAPGKPHA